MTKFCRDCKWLSVLNNLSPVEKFRCTNKETGTRIDPVTGEQISISCYVARHDGASKTCGPEGKYWEAC